MGTGASSMEYICTVDGEDYFRGTIIGHGSYGNVFAIHNKSFTKFLALKTSSKSQLIKDGCVAWVLGERKILTSLQKAPFVARLIKSLQTETEIFMILPLMLGGDLRRHIRRSKPLNLSAVRFILASIVLSMEYLHDHHLMHRDIKPENILMDRNGYCYLSDFNCCKILSGANDRANSRTGTLPYMAPEMLKKRPYTVAVDVWSLGVVAFQLLFCKLPFDHRNDEMLADIIIKSRIEVPKYLDKNLRSLLFCLMNPDPTRRATVKSLKEHPFFDTIDWKKMLRKELKAPYIPDIVSIAGPMDQALLDVQEKGPSRGSRIPRELQHMFSTWDWPTGKVAEGELTSLEMDLGILDNPSHLSDVGTPLLQWSDETRRNANGEPAELADRMGKVFFSLHNLPLHTTYQTLRGNFVRRVSPRIALLFEGSYPKELDGEFVGRRMTHLNHHSGAPSSRQASLYQKLGRLYEMCVVKVVSTKYDNVDFAAAEEGADSVSLVVKVDAETAKALISKGKGPAFEELREPDGGDGPSEEPDTSRLEEARRDTGGYVYGGDDGMLDEEPCRGSVRKAEHHSDDEEPTLVPAPEEELEVLSATHRKEEHQSDDEGEDAP